MDWNTDIFMRNVGVNDRENPTTGVLSLNNCPDWLYDEDEINLDYESALAEWQSENPDEDESEFDYESDSSDTRLYGDWIKDSEGLWIADTSGEYAAIMRESTLQIVWSVNIKQYASPTFQGCYPSQVDIDSGEVETGGFFAYALPEVN